MSSELSESADTFFKL